MSRDASPGRAVVTKRRVQPCVDFFMKRDTIKKH